MSRLHRDSPFLSFSESSPGPGVNIPSHLQAFLFANSFNDCHPNCILREPLWSRQSKDYDLHFTGDGPEARQVERFVQGHQLVDGRAASGLQVLSLLA